MPEACAGLGPGHRPGQRPAQRACHEPQAARACCQRALGMCGPPPRATTPLSAHVLAMAPTPRQQTAMLSCPGGPLVAGGNMRRKQPHWPTA
eukprot:3396642-Lingulodinium_polyedra.AAC.1